MADENRNELNAIVSLMGDVLVELQGIRSGQEAIARTFDRSMTLVVDKLTGIETRLTSIDQKIESVDTKIEQHSQQLSEIQQLKERLGKVEEILFRNNA